MLYQLAKVYDELGNFELAEDYYQRSYDVTPDEYNDARSDCLNDLGTLYWKFNRREEALEKWNLAVEIYPRNKNAKNNLKYFINKYGEPAAVLPLFDDLYHFQNIQVDNYFKQKKQKEFQTPEEADRIISLIAESWNNKIAPEKDKLDTYSAEEKTEWFNDIKINFDSKLLSGKENDLIFEKIIPKAGKNILADKQKKIPVEKNEFQNFNETFPFLPYDALPCITIAAPFISQAGMNPDRLEKILRNGTEKEEEQDLLIWGYEIGSCLLKSFLSEDDDESSYLLSEACDIALDYIDEDDIEDTLELTMQAIKHFDKEINKIRFNDDNDLNLEDITENSDIMDLTIDNRRMYYNIWQKFKASIKLEGEEKVIAELMALHKDWYSYWDSTDFDREFDPDSEFDPYLHITFDSVVVNQINSNNPPQTKFTYNKLTARGDSHLEAIHKIASVLAEEFWEIMTHNEKFNEKRYSRKLKNLK